MGQAEILKILKSKKWMTAKDIHKKLDCTLSAVTTALNKLFKNREILRKGKGYMGNPNLWRIK